MRHTGMNRLRNTCRASSIGLALILVYLSLPIGLYGTIWIIAIAHITRYLSYGSRAMMASSRSLRAWRCRTSDAA